MRARGSESDAAQHLSEVADRRDRLDIRYLEPAARDRYTRRWEAVQSEFVDWPGSALDEADRLVTDVMHDRGYPVEDFGERAELVAADHPQVVEHYRALFDELVQGRQGTSNRRWCRSGVGHTSETTSTEDLRVSFQRYREFFQRLLSA